VLTVTTATGAFGFVADDAAIEPLTAAASDSFTVTVSDGTLSDSKTLAVNIAQAGITESIGSDSLVGTAGDDTFDALAGADKMTGGLGNDSYTVDNVGDKVVETSALLTEIDSVTSAIKYTLKANVENLTLTGTAAINATGNTLANVIIGNAGANTLNGGTGADSMAGGLGNDSYTVDNAGDTVTETSTDVAEIDKVNSTVDFNLGANLENLTLTGTALINGSGNSLDNVLTGNKADNLLLGAAGNDKLSGGTGNDVLDGGDGNDSLNGGAGLDVFRFTVAPTAANLDTLAGFKVIDDTIQFDSAIFSQLTAIGVLDASEFVKAAAAADANDYVIYNPKTGYLSYDADGNGAGLAEQVALLGKNLAMTFGDFIVS
jgi:Ca2+-binding RTX toxin-like protein